MKKIIFLLAIFLIVALSLENKSTEVSFSTSCPISGKDTVLYLSSGFVFSGPSGALSYAWTISGNGSIPGPNNNRDVIVSSGSIGEFVLTLILNNGVVFDTCSKRVVIIPCSVTPDASPVLTNSVHTYKSTLPELPGRTYNWVLTGNVTVLGASNLDSVVIRAGSPGFFDIYLFSNFSFSEDSCCVHRIYVLPDPCPSALTSGIYEPIYGFVPCGMVSDPGHSYNVYVSNSDSMCISKFDSTGTLQKLHFIDLPYKPGALAINVIYGYLYVAKGNGGVDRYGISSTGDTAFLELSNFIPNVKARCMLLDNHPTLPTAPPAIFINNATSKISKYDRDLGSVIDSNFITNIDAKGLDIYGYKLLIVVGDSIREYDKNSGTLTNSNLADSSLHGMSCIKVAQDTGLYAGVIDSALTGDSRSIYLKRFRLARINLLCPIGHVTYIFNRCLGPTNCIVTHSDQIINHCKLVETIIDCNGNITIIVINLPSCEPPDPPLPVELSSFSSSVTLNKVSLYWVTSTEVNNSGFNVERSTNGQWSKLGFVQGNGNSNLSHNYSYDDKNLYSGKYKYRLKQIDYNGNFHYYNLSNEVGIGIPGKFSLSQNYPNPFNPVTKIDYDLPYVSKVRISLFDILGREVAKLVNEIQVAGYHTVPFNANNLSSGIYYYRISAESNGQTVFISTRKLMFLK